MKNNSSTDKIFEYRNTEKKKLTLSLFITVIFMIIEIIGGILTNSIALISDAAHMFTHVFAISIGLFAIYLARKPPCEHKTYGYYRAEVLTAFINGLFLILMAVYLLYESFLRMINPEEINGFYMLIVAIIGLTANITSVIILHGSHKDNINIKGVFFHMIADTASSVGIVIVAIVILYNPSWVILDPIVAVGISLAIAYWAYGVLKETTRILLEIAPKDLDSKMIKNDLEKRFSEILEVYHIHLWTITSNITVFSAYIKLNDVENKIDSEKLVSDINDYLSEKFKIIESTIQIMAKSDLNTCRISKSMKNNDKN